MATVLYVDDETTLRRAVQAWFDRLGDEVRLARTLAEAREHLASGAVDGVFIDLWLPDGSGFELLDWIAEHHPALAERIVFVTGDLVPSDATARQLAMLGRPVLMKPFDLEELERSVQSWRQQQPSSPPRGPDAVAGGTELQG